MLCNTQQKSPCASTRTILVGLMINPRYISTQGSCMPLKRCMPSLVLTAHQVEHSGILSSRQCRTLLRVFSPMAVETTKRHKA